MRARVGKDEFFLKAMEKKPQWKTAYEKLDEYKSDDEIKALDLPDWVRKALITLKKKRESMLKISALKIKETNNADQYFVVRRWQYGDTFLKTIRGVQVQINTDDLFLILDDTQNLVKWSRTTIQLDNSALQELYQKSVLVKEMKYHEYSRFLGDELNSKHKVPNQIIDLTGEQANKPDVTRRSEVYDRLGNKVKFF